MKRPIVELSERTYAPSFLAMPNFQQLAALALAGSAFVQASAPALPNRYGYTQSFSVSGAPHRQVAALDKAEQWLRLGESRAFPCLLANGSPELVLCHRPTFRAV